LDGLRIDLVDHRVAQLGGTLCSSVDEKMKADKA